VRPFDTREVAETCGQLRAADRLGRDAQHRVVAGHGSQQTLEPAAVERYQSPLPV